MNSLSKLIQKMGVQSNQKVQKTPKGERERNLSQKSWIYERKRFRRKSSHDIQVSVPEVVLPSIKCVKDSVSFIENKSFSAIEGASFYIF